MLLTYSRLVQDNEYHGMQASGISILTLAKPGIILALIMTILMILFNNYFLSWSNYSYRKLYYEIIKKRSTIMIQEHTFIDEFDDYTFYIGDKTGKTDGLKNIIVFVKSPDQSEPAKVILARDGKIISDEQSLRIALKLNNGIVQMASRNSFMSMNQIYFDTNFIDLDVKGVLRNKQGQEDLKGSREMTVEELQKEINSANTKHDKNVLKVELQKKFSIPFACLIFALVGIPLGLLSKRGGKIAGISIALAIIFAYYFLLSFGSSYGYSGKFNHFIAVWFSNFSIGAIGIILMIFLVFPDILRKYFRKKNKDISKCK